MPSRSDRELRDAQITMRIPLLLCPLFSLAGGLDETTFLIMKSPDVILACLILNAAFSVRSDPLDAWHWRNPSPFGDSMSSCAFGAGRFVAVGSGGVIHTSVDGTAWDEGR